jgi:VWFA-related protein
MPPSRLPRLSALVVAGWIAAVSAQEQPRFRSGVDVVDVAVIVRDAAGMPVTNLTAGEFELTEGGVRQEVVAIGRVSLPVARLEAAPAAGPAADVSSNESLEQSRVFALVLDPLHVSPPRSLTVRRHAREFIEKHMGPADYGAIFTPGGDAAATEDFTTDKTRLLAAVDRFNGIKLRSATIEREEEDRRVRGTNMTTMHEGRDPSDAERVDRARSLTSLLRALAGNLARVEARRKTLLLFSEGIDYDVSDLMGVAQRSASDVTRDMNRAIGALMRADVALYAIDPRTLGSAVGETLESPVYREYKPLDSISPRGLEVEYAESVRSLRLLSESTGGFALVNSNDVAGAFDRVLQDSSEYYVLGYSPASKAKPGEFRPIEVRVKRPGLVVTARKGYVAQDAPARQIVAEASGPSEPQTAWSPTTRARNPMTSSLPSAEPAGPVRGVAADLASLLSSPLPRPGLPIRVQAVPFKGGNRRDVQVVIEVLGRDLGFVKRGNRAEERIELAMISVDDRGRAGNGRSTTIDLKLTDEELQRVRTTGVRWLSKVQLPAGRHQLRIAGRAMSSGIAGMVTHTFDAPAFPENALGISGLTLTSLPAVLMITRGDGWLEQLLPTPPAAGRAFVAGDRVTVAAELYVPQALQETVTAVARLERPDGSPVQEREGVVTEGKSRSRTATATFETAEVPPGRYVLSMSATHPSSGAPAERRVPISIVGAGR